MTTIREAIPVREGLFRFNADGHPVLLASQCQSCGTKHFPKVPLCLACGEDALGEAEVAATASLFCATTVQMRSTNLQPPYTVGYVKTTDGLMIFGPVDSAGNAALPVGTPMRLEVVPLWRENERDVLSYRFRPLQGVA